MPGTRSSLVSGYSAVSIVVLGAVCCFALSAAYVRPTTGPAEELRAQKFVVVDANGRERAEFGMVGDDQVRLTLRGEKQSASIWIGIDKDGAASIEFVRGDDKPMLELGVRNPEGTAVIVRDGTGHRRCGLIVTDKDSSGIVLSDTSGKQRGAFSVDRTGNVSLKMYDAASTPRMMLSVSSAPGGAALDLYDERGKARLTAQVANSDRADLLLLDSEEKAIWSPQRP